MTENAQNLPQAGIGILGGTGLYQIDGLEITEKIDLETPFGKPSDSFVIGNLEGIRVAFLSRHGKGHHIMPAEINYRANICGFKMLGVERLISVNSVGSLREDFPPRDMVIPDQFFDRTHRKNSFFGEGAVAHVSLARPVCEHLAGVLAEAAHGSDIPVHKGGTYICIEGPAFSTKAESNIYRSWGCDVIGMTAATEAKLCREAEICYAPMNLVTDYDVWHESEEAVSVEMIMGNMNANIRNAKAVLKAAVKALGTGREEECGCGSALANCIVTREEIIPQAAKEKLRFIIGKYIPV